MTVNSNTHIILDTTFSSGEIGGSYNGAGGFVGGAGSLSLLGNSTITGSIHSGWLRGNLLVGNGAQGIGTLNLSESASVNVSAIILGQRGGQGNLLAQGNSTLSFWQLAVGTVYGSETGYGIAILKDDSRIIPSTYPTATDSLAVLVDNGHLELQDRASIEGDGISFGTQGRPVTGRFLNGTRVNVDDVTVAWANIQIQSEFNVRQTMMAGYPNTTISNAITTVSEGGRLSVGQLLAISDEGDTLNVDNMSRVTVGDFTGSSDDHLGAVVVSQGGTLRGKGHINADVVNDGGTIDPGNSPGTLVIDGDLILNSGNLNIEINGTTQGSEYDSLFMTGSASLGGTLNVILGSGFTPGVNDEYEVLRASSISGSFTSVNLPSGWAYNLDGGSLVLTPVPEPMSMIAMSLGLVAMLRRGRRNRQG